MEFFTSERMTPHITRIRGAAAELMYLIEGTEKAMLVDTGCGIGSLKEYVQTLTEKEVEVVLTHGHVDHASGTDGFERIYMNPLDEEVYHRHTGEGFYYTGVKVMAGKRQYERVYPYLKLPVQREMLPLTEGMRFELGGVTLECYAAYGHTSGSMAILIPQERILIIGDACTGNTLLHFPCSLSVESFLHSMEHLQEQVAGRYDTMFFSHGSGISGVGFLESGIELAKEILAGQDDAIPYISVGDAALLAKERNAFMKRLDGGLANIVYLEEKIRDQAFEVSQHR